MTSLALITTKISSLDAHIQLCENHKDTEGVEMAYCRLGPCLCAGQCRGAEPRLTAGCPARIGVRADLGVEEGGARRRRISTGSAQRLVRLQVLGCGARSYSANPAAGVRLLLTAFPAAVPTGH